MVVSKRISYDVLRDAVSALAKSVAETYHELSLLGWETRDS